MTAYEYIRLVFVAILAVVPFHFITVEAGYRLIMTRHRIRFLRKIFYRNWLFIVLSLAGLVYSEVRPSPPWSEPVSIWLILGFALDNIWRMYITERAER